MWALAGSPCNSALTKPWAFDRQASATPAHVARRARARPIPSHEGKGYVAIRTPWPDADNRRAGKEKPRLGGAFLRADGGTRTPDPIITSDVLYQLSYVGEVGDGSDRSSA